MKSKLLFTLVSVMLFCMVASAAATYNYSWSPASVTPTANYTFNVSICVESDSTLNITGVEWNFNETMFKVRDLNTNLSSQGPVTDFADGGGSPRNVNWASTNFIDINSCGWYALDLEAVNETDGIGTDTINLAINWNDSSGTDDSDSIPGAANPPIITWNTPAVTWVSLDTGTIPANVTVEDDYVGVDTSAVTIYNYSSATDLTMDCVVQTPGAYHDKYFCNYTFDVNGISDGEYFNVTASDMAGQSTTSAATIGYDSSAPDETGAWVQITPYNDHYSNATTITVSWGNFSEPHSAIDGYKLYNSTDDGATWGLYSDYTSGTTQQVLSGVNGNNVSIKVSANNSAMEWSTNTTVNHTLLDAVAPTGTLSTPMDNMWMPSTNINFSYTPTDAHSSLLECTLYWNYSGAWGANNTNGTVLTDAGTNWFNFTGLATAGWHEWNVECEDLAGNTAWMNTTNNWTFGIDGTPPTITGIVPADNATGFYNDTTPPLQFNVTDTDSGPDSGYAELNISNSSGVVYAFSVGGGNDLTCTATDPVSCTPDWAALDPLDDGEYNASFMGQDMADNDKTVQYNFTIDLTPPVIQFPVVTPSYNATGGMPEPYVYVNATVNVTAAVSDTESGINGSTCEVSPDNGTTWYDNLDTYDGSNCSFLNVPTNYSGSMYDIQWKMVVRVQDNVTNMMGNPDYTYYQDDEAPEVFFTNPDHDSQMMGGLWFNNKSAHYLFGNVTDYGSVVNYVNVSIDNGTSWSAANDVNGTWNATWAGPDVEGQYYFLVQATDNLGHQNVTYVADWGNVSVNIDNTNPAIALIYPAANYSNVSDSTPYIEFNITDTAGAMNAGVSLGYSQINVTNGTYSALYSEDGANLTCDATGGGYNCSTTFTEALDDGTYYMTFYGEDNATNNNTALYQINIDTVGVNITAATLEADDFVCAYSGSTNLNDDLTIVVAAADIGVSGVSWVKANITQVNDTYTNLVPLANNGTHWKATIVVNDTSSNNFNNVNITIDAQDNAGNTELLWGTDDPFTVAVLYNETLPFTATTCEQPGSGTTNFCNETNFAAITFVDEVEINGSAGCNGGLELPWAATFKKVLKLEFGALNFSDESTYQALENLQDAIAVSIGAPETWDQSSIFVNGTAFGVLNTSTDITLYGLPFGHEPNISHSGTGSGAISSVVFTAQTPYNMGGLMVPNGDLAFTVADFSEYNASDNENPIVTITTPPNNTATNADSILVNVTVNGTGSQVSNLTLYMNSTVLTSLNNSGIQANCANTTADWTEITCDALNVTLSGDLHTITAYAWDFGGGAPPGNTHNTAIQVRRDVVAPTTTPTGNDSTGAAYTFGTWNTETYVNVTLACNDGLGVGCNVTQYCVDTTNTCTPSITYAAPNFQITQQNYTYIRYYSNDTANNTESLGNITVMLDSNAPVLTVSVPSVAWSNATNLSTGWMTFKAVDAVSNTLSCAGWMNGTYVNGTLHSLENFDTNATTANNTDTNFTVSQNYSDGTYYTWVNCTDLAGNETKSTVYTGTQDAVAPTTTINITGGWYGADIPVELTCTDNTNGSGCKLTKYNLNSGGWVTASTFTITNEDNNTLQYYSSDWATASETATTLTNIWLDKTDPTVTMYSPATTTTWNVPITAEVADNNDTTIDCFVSELGTAVSGTTVITTNTTNHNGTITTNMVADGRRTFKVNCTDSAGRTALSVAGGPTVSATPIITLTSPAAGASSTDTTPTLSYSVEENSASVNCTVYVDGTVVVTNQTVDTNMGTNTSSYTSSALALGAHTWKVSCNDSNGFNSTSAQRSLTITTATTPTTTTTTSTGSSDSAPPGPAPTYGFETDFTPTTTTVAGFNDLFGTDETVQDALEDAGIDLTDEAALQQIAETSAAVAENLLVTMDIEHVGTTASRIVLTLSYEGEFDLEGQIVVIDIPKSFASSASSITVTAGGATVLVTQSDPVFTIVFDKFMPQSEKVIRFLTNSYVSRDIVKEDMKAPKIFTVGFGGEAVPLPTPTPVPTSGPTPVPTATPVPTPVPTVIPQTAGFDLGLFGVVFVILVVFGIVALLYVKKPWKKARK
ncbi:hypothetical protein ACFLQ2_04460 [archaeon]